MKIILTEASRKFNRQQVFKNLNYTIESGSATAVLGGNGSGKSTLLKVISSALHCSSGSIEYSINGANIPLDKVPFKVSVAAPYLELIEELTAEEFLIFHRKLKAFKNNFSVKDILEITYLTDSADKEIRNFSSGMKQRLKLGIALLSDSSLIILDEPTSNLDPKGVEWFKEMVSNHKSERTLLIGSNFDSNEIHFCDQKLELKNYK